MNALRLSNKSTKVLISSISAALRFACMVVYISYTAVPAVASRAVIIVGFFHPPPDCMAWVLGTEKRENRKQSVRNLCDIFMRTFIINTLDSF